MRLPLPMVYHHVPLIYTVFEFVIFLFFDHLLVPAFIVYITYASHNFQCGYDLDENATHPGIRSSSDGRSHRKPQIVKD